MSNWIDVFVQSLPDVFVEFVAFPKHLNTQEAAQFSQLAPNLKKLAIISGLATTILAAGALYAAVLAWQCAPITFSVICIVLEESSRESAKVCYHTTLLFPTIQKVAQSQVVQNLEEARSIKKPLVAFKDGLWIARLDVVNAGLEKALEKFSKVSLTK